MSNFFEGKIAEVQFETGFHFKLHYLSDNKMKFVSLKKDENYGYSETEDILVKEVAEGIFNISWVESTGLTVTQNIDLAKQYIYAIMTWHDNDQYGNRYIMGHQGVFRFINDQDVVV